MKSWSIIKTIFSSIIWGLGQLFNKQYLKSLFFFMFFALFITLEVSTSKYFFKPEYDNQIAMEKIPGNSLGEWYEKAFFQTYDGQKLKGYEHEAFEAYLDSIGVEEKDPMGYYGGPTGDQNPTASLFTEDRFIEFFAADLKEASYLRFTQLVTSNVIKYEDFNLAGAKLFTTVENKDLLWDEPNNKFYYERDIIDQNGNPKKEYVETGVFNKLDNPTVIQSTEGFKTFKKTSKIFTYENKHYIETLIAGDTFYLLLDHDLFEVNERSTTFQPTQLTGVTGPLYELNDLVYEYYEPGLINNGVRQQYKQTEFSSLFRRAMVQGQTINPVESRDFVKLMVRVYMDLNPTFKEQYLMDFDNFFNDRAGMFTKGYWEVLTLGQTKEVNLNSHLALIDAMLGTANEPEVTNMRAKVQYEGQVNIRGHVSTLLLLDGLIAVILSAFFMIFAIWSAIDAYRVSEKKRLELQVDGTKAYFKNVWDNGFEYIILSPALFVLAFITLMPIIFGFVLAFTSIGGAGSMDKLFDWVGFKNFISVFDPNSAIGQGFGTAFWRVLGWTIIWAVLSTFTCFFGGFFQALILNAESVVFRKLWRTILILPWAIPGILSQMVFSVMFNENGFINQFLMQAGFYDLFKSWGILGVAYQEVAGLAKVFWLGFDNIQWFTNFHNPNFVRGVLVVVNIWLGFPYFMALMTGIMTAIDKSLYEAADIDGATGFQKLAKITMPLVLYSTAPILIMTFSGNFNNFGVIHFITGGGPGDLTSPINGFAGKTDILISWMYRLTTDHQIYNMASVFSVLIFLFVGSITAWNLSRTKAFQED